MFRSETTFRTFSNSVFNSEEEYGSLNNPSCHITWKIQLYANSRKIEVFYTVQVFSIFRPERSLKNIEKAHILACREILYRIVYKTSKKNFLEPCFTCILCLTTIQKNLIIKSNEIAGISWKLMPKELLGYPVYAFING
jgi:hypothetical protein